jgi:hypothetical protein
MPPSEQLAAILTIPNIRIQFIGPDHLLTLPDAPTRRAERFFQKRACSAARARLTVFQFANAPRVDTRYYWNAAVERPENSLDIFSVADFVANDGLRGKAPDSLNDSVGLIVTAQRAASPGKVREFTALVDDDAAALFPNRLPAESDRAS